MHLLGTRARHSNGRSISYNLYFSSSTCPIRLIFLPKYSEFNSLQNLLIFEIHRLSNKNLKIQNPKKNSFFSKYGFLRKTVAQKITKKHPFLKNHSHWKKLKIFYAILNSLSLPTYMLSCFHVGIAFVKYSFFLYSIFLLLGSKRLAFIYVFMGCWTGKMVP